jgi:phage terminase large subunit-like protein
MTVLAVPPFEPDGEEWPSLGSQVCAFIEQNLVFGPGDLRGLRAKLDDEKRALIYRMYEVYPRGTRDGNGKPIEGRRRFRRVALSLQKGSAKTELAAWIAAVELHPEGPVRCDGFDASGNPVGRPVVDPYIPMMAYTEEQADDLAYAALKAILELSPISGDFDIGMERIIRAMGDGKAVALAGAPDARDGARTTFSHKDETHRWNLPRLIRAHRTTIANLTKRPMAEPWELETTTAYVPGENSVAEQTASYAKDVADGKIQDPRLFFFHRQARDGYDLTDPEQLRAAIVEAAGPTAAWKDINGITEQWQDPTTDKPYLERVFLNRPIATAAQAFNVTQWERNERSELIVPGAVITLGFDGSINEDTTALIATNVLTGFQWPIGIWARPEHLTDRDAWQVPKGEVDAAVDQAFTDFDIWRMYADPSKWDTWLAIWAGKYEAKRVVAWSTTLYRKMAVALRAYANAIEAGEATHNGDPTFTRHIGNAQKNPLNFRDDDGAPLWLIQKDRPGSPNKIDAAMAGCLSWQARLDAVAAGAGEPQVVGVFFA